MEQRKVPLKGRFFINLFVTTGLFLFGVGAAAQSQQALPVDSPVEALVEPPAAPETALESKTKAHWGAALGVAWIHDYPGANQGRMRYLVMPTYKGKFLTIDRQDGVKGELVSEDMLKFAISFSFLFPTSTDKIPVRQGMPGLDWVFQLGPEMQLYLFRSFFHTMYVRLPFRFAATTDFKHNFEYREWVLSPGIRNIFYLGKGRGEITTRFDIDYASERFNDYFHQVDQRYATPARPAFNAREGLLEYIVGINYSYYDSFPWTFFIGGNLYLMGDGVNRASPLMVRTRNYSVLGGIIRYF